MPGKKAFTFLVGFFILFFVYHFPEIFSAFWIMATFKIGFLIVAYILSILQGWKNLQGYGLAVSQGWYSMLLKGLCIGLIFFSFSVLISILIGYEQLSEISTFKNIMKQLPFILLMTFFPSLAEDILTRGYLYGHLKHIKPFAWILLSSMIYVLNHIWRLNDGPAVLTYLFLLGLVLAIAVWITKSLWLAFGIHWGANIAFELSHSALHTQSLVNHDGETWLLAACWGLLLSILFIKNKPLKVAFAKHSIES